jgi:hypothetical protein
VADYPESESLVIGRIIRMLNRGSIVEAIQELRNLQEQAAKGHHRNPPLGIRHARPKQHYQSQVVGTLSKELHLIRYRHAEDGRQYEHEFVNPTSVLALFDGEKHDILITSPDGWPIWQDF